MRWFIAVCLIISLIVPLCSAELLINPNPLPIAVKLNAQKTFNLTLQNTFNFNISNFAFSNTTGFTFPTDIFIEPNQTKTVYFDVLQNSLKSETVTSVISFKYNVDIPEQVTTHHINITDTGFNPSYLTIHQEDTVIWHNHDDISHTVTGSTFDYDLPVNGTTQMIFNDIGEFGYQDLIVFWAGTINVISKDSAQLVHNPSYDKTLTINLDVYSDPTNLSIYELSKRIYNIEVGNSDNAYLIIENNGNETAQKIHLSSTNNWIDFESNNFDIDAGERKAVNFDVVPLVINSNDTNKNHTITITVKALNTGEITDTIEVFIPYKEFDESDPAYIVKILEDFCNRNPNNAFCNPPNATSGEVIVRDPEIPVNLTASEVYAMLKRIQRIEDSNQRADNRLNALTTVIEQQFPEFKNILNQTYNQAQESEDRRSTNEVTFWIIGIFILVGGTTWYITGFWRKYRRKKYMQGVTK